MYIQALIFQSWQNANTENKGEPYQFAGKCNFKVWGVGRWCPFKTDWDALTNKLAQY